MTDRSRAVLLGLLLGLHFLTRLHAQQVTPLASRHFYPASYYVSLSLLQGGGFRYLLPADTVAPAGRSLEAAVALSVPPPGNPRSAVLGFIQLAGNETVSPSQMRDYMAADTRLVEPDPVESTRVFDIYLAALIWRVFGISWPAYFAFYALLSTVACSCVFFTARTATGSFWWGMFAAAGFLASPLELYAGVWSTRDTAPLWFTAVGFGALAGFSAMGRGRATAALGGLALGVASLLGLGWRVDAQLVPPAVLCGLVLTLAAQSRPRLDRALALGGFVAGCIVVLVLVRTLAPVQFNQGENGFHAAWYGEFTRSNQLQTQNAFQVARDDYLTLYQANYYARGRYGASPEGSSSRNTKDLRHYERCREMYLEMARYNAASWWSGFPSFLARSARLDRPTLLASEAEATDFLERRPAAAKLVYRLGVDRYGAVLPWLALAGLLGGLLHRSSRVLVTVMAAYFAYYAAAALLVLPEPKHMAPLLLPIHILAAVGLWSLARAARWLRATGRSHPGESVRVPVAACAAVLLGWGALGLAAHAVSRQQRARFLAAIRAVAAAAPETPLNDKLFSVHVDPEGGATHAGYLLRVRALRPANLICVHVREGSTPERFLAYYTRHPLEPGEDRFFFFNPVAGRGVGETRSYTAHVRLAGPARLVGVRALDLARWPLGLPLSLVFADEQRYGDDVRAGGEGAASEGLPTLAEVGHLLEDPGAFFRSYRPD